MHFRYGVYFPLAITAVVATGATPPHAEYAVQAAPDNGVIKNSNTLHARQDDPADAETAACKDPNTETFWCFMCGGKGDDGKCKGVSAIIPLDESTG